MFCRSLVRCATTAARPSLIRPVLAANYSLAANTTRVHRLPSAYQKGTGAVSPLQHIQPARFGSGRPEKSAFEQRALELLKGFEKIDPAKLTLGSHFNKDLGLDSLDTVEVLMAIEDEFMIEIPDAEADNIHTVQEAIDYVYERWTPQHNW